jgi:thiamine-monophosphate kinase
MPTPNESELIERIRRGIPSRPTPSVDGARLGIGDDAAVVRPRPGRELVISSDQFLEGRHFLAQRHPADSVGYKALARAASDLAAMGATARYFFLNLALPASCTGDWLDEFLRGMARAAREFQMILLGGDLASLPTVAISLTVFGEIAAGGAVTRSGARPGDGIFVSGTLGRAGLGLKIFLRRRREVQNTDGILGAAGDALRAHLYPQPRLALGQWLARKRLASAMIDISDGLSTDLAHLCAASKVGARIEMRRVPATRIPAQAKNLATDSFALALHGGEDYELLFTVPARLAAKIPTRFGKLALTRIGEITRSRKILLISNSGKPRPLAIRGWDHFRKLR